MSAYDNDPRVRVQFDDWRWIVEVNTATHPWLCPTGRVVVVKGDDGLCRVFEDEREVGGNRYMGDLIPERLFPAGDFYTVVHALIGDPQ